MRSKNHSKLRKILNKHIEEQHNYEKIILLSNQNFANIISFFSSLNLAQIKKIFIERNSTPVGYTFLYF